MNKKCKWIVCLGCLSAVCALAAACGKETKDDEMAKQGYVIAVTYDPSDGSFFNRTGVTITDYYNPESFTADINGDISFKLKDPLSSDRKSETGATVSLDKTGYSLVGWYTDRTIVKNGDGKVISESGIVLTENIDGTYYYLNEKGDKVECQPAYTYSGLWDFSTDKVSYNAEDYTETDGRYKLTLYAGWLPYFQFEYMQKVGEEWQSFATTSFDYLSNKEKSGDKDTMWVPRWQNQQTQSGAMNYTHAYTSDAYSVFNFPKVSGKTFLKAYSDPECTQEITDSIRHGGSIMNDPCQAVNAVQKIYVQFTDGEQYRITTADEFCSNGNVNGHYQIFNDLDLTGKKWPTVFTTGTFNGKIYAAEGVNSVTISNVETTIDTDFTEYGGLFGYVSETAVIKDVTFKDLTLTINKAHNKDMDSTSIGLFAGEIDEEATLSNVKVEDGRLIVKDFTMYGEWKLNALANGDTTGLAKINAITLEFYADTSTMDTDHYFSYAYDPRTIQIAADGAITFTTGSVYSDDEEGEDLLQKYEKTYE